MWIKKVYRQHGSMVLTLPKQVQRLMKLDAGDYLMIGFRPKDKALQMTKVVHGDEHDAESKTGTDSGHKGRRSRAESGRR